jgi:2,4-dienoyl-CoA reductase-like NADH-dependent reductase (Old Yellow Enzyme family)
MTSPLLLRPLNIGAMRLPNRLVMPALTRMRAGPDGVPTDLMRDYYAQRASAGLIVTECTMVSPQARGLLGCPGIYNEAQQQGWSKVSEAVHAAGGRMFCQLWHAGAASHPTLQPDGGAPVAHRKTARPSMHSLPAARACRLTHRGRWNKMRWPASPSNSQRLPRERWPPISMAYTRREWLPQADVIHPTATGVGQSIPRLPPQRPHR